VYRVEAFTSVGVPLMVQVVLLILKPAGSVGAAVPAGLSIDSATCTISGTPTKMRALNIYTVTAKDAKDNTGSASFGNSS
jgi:hypothetical protein